ncbi:MAG: hypothetical protein Ct9H300mP25_15620 [Acidobacteriota bacterium]|nr:MAG: hypothetical protein Ct9H300mP25_15620 [Acidobacteriota bacterium]
MLTPVNVATGKAGKSLDGTVAASDAFFPFRDGLDGVASEVRQRWCSLVVQYVMKRLFRQLTSTVFSMVFRVGGTFGINGF